MWNCHLEVGNYNPKSEGGNSAINDSLSDSVTHLPTNEGSINLDALPVLDVLDLNHTLKIYSITTF